MHIVLLRHAMPWLVDIQPAIFYREMKEGWMGEEGFRGEEGGETGVRMYNKQTNKQNAT